MEPPATFEADALRDEKVKVLRAIGPALLDQRNLAGIGNLSPADVRRVADARIGTDAGHPDADLHAA